MSIDSSAELLFNIGANTDDAESNILRFRSLMGKDLSDLGGEFDAWAEKLVGDLGTVKGALIATSALMGAGLVAAAGMAVEAARKYSEYVDAVSKGSRVTGISVESMSKLKFAAEATHTSYEALTQGLTRFASNVVKAAQGSEAQAKAFTQLGISHEQLVAGEKDLNGLLMVVADKFQTLGSRVLQTAEARELFARGGPALVQMLSQGSEGIRALGLEAEKLGLVIGTKDVEANEQYKASIHLLKAEMEAVTVTVGREVLPAFAALISTAVGFLEAMGKSDNWKWYDYLTAGTSRIVKFGAQWRVSTDEVRAKVEELAKSLSKFGGEGDSPLAQGAKEAKGEWQGLSDVLEKVRERALDLSSVDEKTTKELEQTQFGIDKLVAKYRELSAAGKLTKEDAATQAAALAQMPAAMSALMTHYIDEINRKNDQAGEDLVGRTAAQAEQTYAVKAAAWEREIDLLAEKLGREQALQGGNEDKLFALWVAGRDKLRREQDAAVQSAGEDLDARLGQQREKTYAEQVAAWDREIQKLTEKLQKEGALKGANADKLAELDRAGRDKIDRDKTAAYTAEMGKLSTHMASMLTAQMSQADKLRVVYERDLQAYSDVELKKEQARTANGPEQQLAIEQHFAQLRKQLLTGYQADLQALTNSQGWQGVFGGKFGELLRGNETLMKQWATSANQSSMLMKVSLEGLEETGRKTFESLAQGMGGNIASAIVHSKSIKEAMKAELESTLENLAAQSITYAIYSTALGFTRLAQYDATGATQAFTAAAIWGSVGAASAVAGRAMAGPAAGASGGAGTAAGGQVGGASTGSAAAAGSSAGAGGPGGPHVTVNVWGHVVGVSGVSQLASMLNDAVLNSDVQLTSTNTKTGAQVVR
jgi:hypothetical protein